MGRLVWLCAGLTLMVTARPCVADPPEKELARCQEEIARLLKENAALKRQLEALGPLQGDFQGVLKERSVTLFIPPPLASGSTYRQGMRLHIDLGHGAGYDLAFKSPQEAQKARAWKGQKLVVRGSVRTAPGNPFAQEFFVAPSSCLAVPARFPTLPGMKPPARWVLVVESWKPGEGAESPKDARAKLQGTWRVVGLGVDGLRLREGHNQIKDARIVISGNRAVIRGNHLTLVGPTQKEKEKSFDFVLDLSTKPREIQFANNREKLRGIYRLEGDNLQLCFLKGEEAKTPTDFSARSGSKRWLYLLRRERPDRGEGKNR